MLPIRLVPPRRTATTLLGQFRFQRLQRALPCRTISTSALTSLAYHPPRLYAGRRDAPVSFPQDAVIGSGFEAAPPKPKTRKTKAKLDLDREPDNSRLQLFTAKKIQLSPRFAPTTQAPSVKVPRNKSNVQEPESDLPSSDNGRPLRELVQRHFGVEEWDAYQATDEQVVQLVHAIQHEAAVGQIKDVVHLYGLLKSTIQARRGMIAQQRDAYPEEVRVEELQLPVTRDLFAALLDIAAEQGSTDNARAVLQDMAQVQVDPTIFELNKALEVAAKAKDELFAVEVMDQIATLPLPDPQSATDPTPVEVPRLFFEGNDTNLPDFAGIFHPDYVHSWTPETIHALIKLANATNNIEFALCLLGLATARARQEGDYPASLQNWLLPECRDTLVHLLLQLREPGLAYDVCRLCIASGGDESLPSATWLALLRACADLHFMPGIVLGWKVLTNRSVEIHEGLTTLVLEACGRNGACSMAERAFQKILQLKANQFQDWHVLPLLEAYIRAHRWEKAFGTLALARRAGVELNETVEDMLSNALDAKYGNELDSFVFSGEHNPPTEEQRLKAREVRIDAAIRAMYAVGKVPSPQGGVDIVVLNAVLKAIATSSEPQRVTQVLRHAQRLYGVASSSAPSDPATAPRVSPTIHTYNAALLALVELGDRPAAEALLANTLAEPPLPNEDFPVQGPPSGPMKWTRVTYERLIHLSLRMQDIERALKLHRGARSSKLYLTFSTYLSLVLYMYHRQVPTWREMLLEMKESGAPMPKVEYLQTVGLTAADWKNLSSDPRTAARRPPVLMSYPAESSSQGSL